MSRHLYGSSPTQRKIAAGLVALVLFGAAQLSHANSGITLNTSGAWTSYTANDSSVGAVVSGLNTAQLSWGVTPPVNAALQSGLIFSQTSYGLGSELSLDTAFSVGTLTHSNHVINIATGISDANLRLNFTFGNNSTPTQFNYNFNILETPNSIIDPLLPLAGCSIWQSSLTPCDDIISFANEPTSQQFSLDGQLFSFNLLGFSGFNENTGPYKMITTENTETTQFLMAKITAVPTPVPAPAALWLLGSGLLGLAGFSKRKRIPQ